MGLLATTISSVHHYRSERRGTAMEARTARKRLSEWKDTRGKGKRNTVNYYCRQFLAWSAGQSAYCHAVRVTALLIFVPTRGKSLPPSPPYLPRRTFFFIFLVAASSLPFASGDRRSSWLQSFRYVERSTLGEKASLSNSRLRRNARKSESFLFDFAIFFFCTIYICLLIVQGRSKNVSMTIDTVKN